MTFNFTPEPKTRIGECPVEWRSRLRSASEARQLQSRLTRYGFKAISNGKTCILRLANKDRTEKVRQTLWLLDFHPAS